MLDKLALAANECRGYGDLFDVLFGGKIKHRLEHYTLKNGLKTSCTGLVLDCKSCYLAECLVLKLKLDSVHRKKLLVLLVKRTARLFYDSHKRVLVKIFKRHDNGKSTDKLGDKSVFYNVVRGNVLVNALFDLYLTALASLCEEAYLLRALALLDYLLNAVKCTAADEEDVFGVYLNKLLIGMLSSALRRYVCNGALNDLKKRLLYALTRNVTRYRAVFALS